MYRSIRAMWLSAALAALGGGHALMAQSATPAANRERFVSLELDGGKATRCRVLKTWNDSEGNRCLQVQAVFTGQRMTVVQKFQEGNLSEVQVYNWGGSKESPPGAPVPTSVSDIQQTSNAAPPAQLPPVDDNPPSAKGGDGKGTKGAGDPGTKGNGTKGAGDPGTKGNGTKGAGDPGTKGNGTKGDPNTGGKGSAGKGSGVAIVPSTSEPANGTGNWRQSWGQSEPVPADQAAMSVKPLPRADKSKADPLPTVIEAAQERVAKQEAAAEKYAKPSRESIFSRIGIGRETTPGSTASNRMPADGETAPTNPTNGRETRPKRDGSSRVAGVQTGRPSMVGTLPAWGFLGRRVGQPGTASILAAGADPEMVANFKMPEPGRVPEGMPSVPPGVMIPPAYAYTPGPKQFAPGAYVPGGLANAFSPQGGQRPIPADVPMMGQPAETNAFAAQGRPQPAPVAYQPAMVVMPAQQIVRTLPNPAPVLDHRQAITTLKNALLPSEREAATMELANRSLASNPEVVGALVLALQTDPAPAVRGSAARSLAKLGTTREEVVQALKNQRQDNDARVRLEVDNAILQLTSATSR